MRLAAVSVWRRKSTSTHHQSNTSISSCTSSTSRSGAPASVGAWELERPPIFTLSLRRLAADHAQGRLGESRRGDRRHARENRTSVGGGRSLRVGVWSSCLLVRWWSVWCSSTRLRVNWAAASSSRLFAFADAHLRHPAVEDVCCDGCTTTPSLIGGTPSAHTPTPDPPTPASEQPRRSTAGPTPKAAPFSHYSPTQPPPPRSTTSHNPTHPHSPPLPRSP